MFNRDIISNKFDLNWSTTFSNTGVQQFLQNPTPCTTFLRKKRNLNRQSAHSKYRSKKQRFRKTMQRKWHSSYILPKQRRKSNVQKNNIQKWPKKTTLPKEKQRHRIEQNNLQRQGPDRWVKSEWSVTTMPSP